MGGTRSRKLGGGCSTTWERQGALNYRNSSIVTGESESESRSDVTSYLGPHSPWNSPGQNTGVGSRSLLQGVFPTQGSNPGLPHCSGFFTSEPRGKPKNTGVCCHSLLQGVFLIQESNWGLLHCRWILYQLSYQREMVSIFEGN